MGVEPVERDDGFEGSRFWSCLLRGTTLIFLMLEPPQLCVLLIVGHLIKSEEAGRHEKRDINSCKVVAYRPAGGRCPGTG